MSFEAETSRITLIRYTHTHIYIYCVYSPNFNARFINNSYVYYRCMYISSLVYNNNNNNNLPENDAERKDLEEDRGADGQMLLLACHGQGCKGEGSIVKGQLKGDVNRVEEYLLAYELDFELLVVEVTGHLPDLAHRVVNEAPSFASVMQSQSYE